MRTFVKLRVTYLQQIFRKKNGYKAKLFLAFFILKFNLSNCFSGNNLKTETSEIYFNQINLSSDSLNKFDSLIKSIQVPFKFSGYLDMYYFKNLNNPKNSLNTGRCGAARAFDQRENQFQLGLIQTKFDFKKSFVAATVDLCFGPSADLANYGNKIGPLGANVGSSALSIKQAYISYQLNKSQSITVGQFGTHIGIEAIESFNNSHYSLSNLANNGPFYHQGIKLNFESGDKIAGMIGVVNNWDNLYDNNRFKSIISQISYMPNSKISLTLNYIGGNESDYIDSTGAVSFYAKDTIGATKQLIDLVFKSKPFKKLSLDVNAAFGVLNYNEVDNTKGTTVNVIKNWGGIAAYLNYDFNSKVNLSLRGEYFDNISGVQYIGKNDVKSITAGLTIKLNKGDLMIKPECRMDIFKRINDYDGIKNLQQFMDSDGIYSQNKQITIGGAVIYKF